MAVADIATVPIREPFPLDDLHVGCHYVIFFHRPATPDVEESALFRMAFWHVEGDVRKPAFVPALDDVLVGDRTMTTHAITKHYCIRV